MDDYRKIRESSDSCQVKQHSKPWIARLSGEFNSSRLPDGFFCGGTLIGPRTVITAAHCACQRIHTGTIGLMAKNPDCTLWKETKVILGDYQRTETTEWGRLIQNDCNDRKENEQCLEIQFGEAHPKWTGKLCIGLSIYRYFLKNSDYHNRKILFPLYVNK